MSTDIMQSRSAMISMRFVLFLISAQFCTFISGAPNELEIKLDNAKNEITHGCYGIARLASAGPGARDELQRLIDSRLDHCYQWMDSIIAKRFEHLGLILKPSSQSSSSRIEPQDKYSMERICPHMTTGILSQFAQFLESNFGSEEQNRRKTQHQNIRKLMRYHDNCRKHIWKKPVTFNEDYSSLLDGSVSCTWPQVSLMHYFYANPTEDSELELKQLTEHFINNCLFIFQQQLFDESIALWLTKGQFVTGSEIAKYLEKEERDASELGTNMLNQINARNLYQNRLEHAIFFNPRIVFEPQLYHLKFAEMYANGHQLCDLFSIIDFYSDHLPEKIRITMAILQSILSIDKLKFSRKPIDSHLSLRYVLLWNICSDINLIPIPTINY